MSENKKMLKSQRIIPVEALIPNEVGNISTGNVHIKTIKIEGNEQPITEITVNFNENLLIEDSEPHPVILYPLLDGHFLIEGFVYKVDNKTLKMLYFSQINISGKPKNTDMIVGEFAI